jgi:ABC-type polysaccharide/polyol phosphate transport system ATPase subunit
VGNSYLQKTIPMFAEPTQGQVKVTENILELIS